MHVLAVAPFRAPFGAPHLGAFFRDHMVALSGHGYRGAMLTAELRSLATLHQGEIGRHIFRTRIFDDEGIELWKYLSWRVPLMPQLNAFLWKRAVIRLAKKYCDRYGRPDIIHANWALHAGYAARAISRELNVPYVILEHNSAVDRNALSHWERKQTSLAYRDAAGVAAVSTSLARRVGRLARRAQVEVIPNVIRPDRFSITSRPHRGAIYRFLSVCHLQYGKGVDLLLTAFAEAFSDHADVELVVGGDGALRKSLEELAGRLGIAGRVKFLGRISIEEVSRAMQSADAFVLASRHETFGVVLIEAMATGLPVIATACGGPEDIIEVETGHLVPVEDVAALSRAMDEMYCNRETWAERRQDIRLRAMNRFSPERVGKKLAAFYTSALSSDRGNT